jgi:flagella basal body P-ring formation protein FlgA
VAGAWLGRGPGGSGAAEFRLRQECRAAGALLKLGDVAEVFAPDNRQAAALAQIELFPAPAAPQERAVHVREIQDLLLLRGLNLSEHRFSGSSRVLVLGSGSPGIGSEETLPFATARMAERRMREAVVLYLQEQAGAEVPWSVELELSSEQAGLAADPGAAVTVAGGRPPWTGPQQFVVRIEGPGRPVEFTLAARVGIPPRVVVALRSLGRGELIGGGDVALRHRPADDSDSVGFTSLEEVLGKETTRAVPQGKTLEREWVRAPLLVRRGEVVTVRARSAGICVRTTARARDDGSLGDLVAVESLLDRKTYSARVAGIREVEVYARSIQASPIAAAPTAAFP